MCSLFYLDDEPPRLGSCRFLVWLCALGQCAGRTSLSVYIKFRENNKPKDSAISMWLLWSPLELDPLPYLAHVTHLLTSFDPLLYGPMLPVPLTSCCFLVTRGDPTGIGVKECTPALHSDGHQVRLVSPCQESQKLIDEITVEKRPQPAARTPWLMYLIFSGPR